MFINEFSSREKELFIDLVKIIINSDNVIHETEINLVNAYCLEMGISVDDYTAKNTDYKSILNEFASSSNLVKKVVLLEAVALSLADDDLSKQEQDIIDQIVKIFNFDQSIVDEAKKVNQDCKKAISNIVVFVNS